MTNDSGGEVSGAWKSGGHLVVVKDAVLPDVCLRCGRPAGAVRVRRNLWWHSPVWYALMLLGLFPYLVAAVVFLNRRIRIDIPLCRRHAERHRGFRTAAFVTFLLSIGVFAFGVATAAGLVPLAVGGCCS